MPSKDCGDKVRASGWGLATEPMAADLWELGRGKRFDCKWATTEAVLTWTEYWHYWASAHSDVEDMLFTNWDDYPHLVEDFADEQTEFGEYVWIYGPM